MSGIQAVQARPVTLEGANFVKYAMSIPLLEREEEFELAQRWRHDGDEDALHRLVQPYMRLVVSIAGKFRNYGLAYDDLIHEGVVGLMQAAERFEPDRNIRFSTYAGWWVRSTIQDFVLRNWSIVRTGTTAAHKTLFFRLRRLQSMIEDYVDGPMTKGQRKKIARRLKVRHCDVVKMEARLAGRDSSLNTHIGEEDSLEWIDLLPDERPLPEDVVAREHDSACLAALLEKAIQILDERERHIITQRLLKEKGETLSALGDSIGISKERVRQIERQALDKLREFVSAQLDDSPNHFAMYH